MGVNSLCVHVMEKSVSLNQLTHSEIGGGAECREEIHFSGFKKVSTVSLARCILQLSHFA